MEPFILAFTDSLIIVMEKKFYVKKLSNLILYPRKDYRFLKEFFTFTKNLKWLLMQTFKLPDKELCLFMQ